MTNIIEEKKAIFIEKNNIQKNILKESNELYSRLKAAEEKAVELEEESAELKSKRPSLLADNKDVSKLNKRLKKIEEEIEINKDTITGITEKQKKIDNDYYNARQDENIAFNEYVDEILKSIVDEYTEKAKAYAEIMQEYLTLEYIKNGHEYNYLTSISHNDIRRIPDVNNHEKPLMEYSYYGICDKFNEKVRTKYNIPDFTMYKPRKK